MSRSSWRTQPMPPGWVKTRSRILAHSRVCYMCGGFAYEVDHITPASQGGTEDDANLAPTCMKCHRSKTGREGRDAQGYRKRPPEAHPGFVSDGL